VFSVAEGAAARHLEMFIYGVGLTFRILGTHLTEAEKLLWGKFPRRLCGDWRAVRDALGLKATLIVD
jgi:hypothetical protein